MKPAKTSLLIAAFLCPLLFSPYACTPGISDISHESIIGDYLIDRTDLHSVFYTTVYERNDTLYVFPELSPQPAVMEMLTSDPPTYKAGIESMGTYTLTFSGLVDGQYKQLSMARDNSEFLMEGQRHTADIQKLRAYHDKTRTEYTYRVPLQLNDGLPTGTVHDTEIDTAALTAMMNDILQNYDYMRSLLVIKDGKLVVEEYFNGWDPVRIHRLQSVTKSVTSTLVGLAVEQGIIESVDDPIHIYLPQYDSLLTGKKRDIRIEHLLTMSAGFEWNEDATYYVSPKDCDAHLAEASGDFIGYVLSKPLVKDPGQYYEYNSGYPNILGHIICERSGMNILEYSLKHLFTPLGVERLFWSPIHGEADYRPGCAGGLRLTSRDMARYGYLYLSDGAWNGRQVIAKDWVGESIEGKMDTRYNTTYGYFWKRTTSLDGKHEIFFASGTGGQYIACLPDLGAVVVTTARFNTDKSDAVAMLLLEQLIPALAGS